jgi:hypothetical protein
MGGKDGKDSRPIGIGADDLGNSFSVIVPVRNKVLICVVYKG